MPALIGLDGPIPTVSIAQKPPPQIPDRSIAVLMPGPSLPQVWNQEKFPDYDMVIAVNTAIWHYKAHWLAAVDKHIFKRLWTLPSSQWPLIGCITQGRNEIDAQKRNLKTAIAPLRVKAMRERQVRIVPPAKSVQCAYTGPNAIAFALNHTGAGGKVHVYGMDFSFDRLDFAGAKGTHVKSRWLAEGGWMKAIWDKERIEVFGALRAPILAYFRGERGEMAWS